MRGVQPGTFVVCRLEEQSSATKATINVVNSERKVSQTAAQKKINELEDQWRSTLSKNAEIGAACRELEMELAGLQQQLHSRYHVPPPLDIWLLIIKGPCSFYLWALRLAYS